MAYNPCHMTEFSLSIIAVLQSIPPGVVASYGQIAALAGRTGAARQVARLLHSSAGKLGLPWHRVLGADGSIRLPEGGGFELQCALLEAEGIEVHRGQVDLSRWGWKVTVN